MITIHLTTMFLIKLRGSLVNPCLGGATCSISTGDFIVCLCCTTNYQRSVHPMKESALLLSQTGTGPIKRPRKNRSRSCLIAQSEKASAVATTLNRTPCFRTDPPRLLSLPLKYIVADFRGINCCHFREIKRLLFH